MQINSVLGGLPTVMFDLSKSFSQVYLEIYRVKRDFSPLKANNSKKWMDGNTFFTFLLNKVFVAASKPKAKRNKTVFILYASNSPSLIKRTKKQVFNFYSTLCWIA